jgi:hypothetical protein
MPEKRRADYKPQESGRGGSSHLVFFKVAFTSISVRIPNPSFLSYSETLVIAASKYLFSFLVK